MSVTVAIAMVPDVKPLIPDIVVEVSPESLLITNVVTFPSVSVKSIVPVSVISPPLSPTFALEGEYCKLDMIGALLEVGFPPHKR